MSSRAIWDNLLIAQEMFYFLKIKKKGKQGYFDVKMIMTKAYDQVDWGFLEALLVETGFP